METAVFLSVLALFGTIVGGLFKLFADANKTQILHADAQMQVASALDKVASTNKEIADATRKGADEAEARNGHLAEIVAESKAQVINRIDGLVINRQTVKNQVVEHEIVNNKE